MSFVANGTTLSIHLHLLTENYLERAEMNSVIQKKIIYFLLLMKISFSRINGSKYIGNEVILFYQTLYLTSHRAFAEILPRVFTNVISAIVIKQ